MTSTDRILADRDGALSVLRITRPDKKNALTADMYAALERALKAGEADAGVAVHVLLGLPGAFSAGNDVEEFARAATGGRLGHEVVDFLLALAALEKPLVCGVDGLAIGVGTTLLFHADLVFASDRSVFRTPFVDLGLVPEAASSLLAPNLMGHALAFELLCCGQAFDAARAAAVGLVNRVVAPEEVEPTALAVARDLAAKPALALRAARRLLRARQAPGRDQIVDRIHEEAAEFSRRLAAPEAAAAFAAFLSKPKTP